MFSQTSEYALRAMVQLAFAGQAGCSTDDLASKTQVPRAYLSKVLQGLRTSGLILSKRGAGGGVCLTRPPGEITILDVINAVDPIQRIHTCPLRLQSHGVRLCSLHSKIDDALSLIEQSFRSTTLEQLTSGDGHRPAPLCDMPLLNVP